MENTILTIERQLYSSLSVADKYDCLEQMRLGLDYLYKKDRRVYDLCRRSLKDRTWDALERAWTLWDTAPKNTGIWGGPEDRTFFLNKKSKYYESCKQLGFCQCRYDIYGSPDFAAVTYPGSIVDITDLYDSLSVAKIKKRGGSRESLQERAQERMSLNLEQVLQHWAKKKHIIYNQYNCFYKWRDELDLVPHEDTNCRSMRLVPRPVHKAFTHRGGIANAINIREHFG